MSETLKGQLEHIVYANEETLYTVAKMQVDGMEDPITTVGVSGRLPLPFATCTASQLPHLPCPLLLLTSGTSSQRAKGGFLKPPVFQSAAAAVGRSREAAGAEALVQRWVL